MSAHKEQQPQEKQALPLEAVRRLVRGDGVEVPQRLAANAVKALAKAAEVLVLDLTARAAAECRRRQGPDAHTLTLSKADIAAAAARSEVFDFLIDYLPRQQTQPAIAGEEAQQQLQATTVETAAAVAAAPEHTPFPSIWASIMSARTLALMQQQTSGTSSEEEEEFDPDEGLGDDPFA